MYSIQDVSKKTGLSAHTLRYYEKEGLLSHVDRSPGGFRQYNDEDMEALGLICWHVPAGNHPFCEPDARGRPDPPGAGGAFARSPAKRHHAYRRNAEISGKSHLEA